MFGSCCEEQEAQEAAVRSRIRAATRASEKRLFGRSLEAARAQSQCEGLCCSVECSCCEEEEDEENAHELADEQLDPPDDEEAELLQRLRAARLAQLHSAAEKQQAAQRAAGFAYAEERELLSMLDRAAAPPIVCLLAFQDDSEVSAWLDDHMTVPSARPLPSSLEGRRQV